MRPSALFLSLALTLVSITACTTATPPMTNPMPPSETTSCNADAAKPGAVGKTATAAVVERARIDAGARSVRVLKPGQMVTMEYIEGRLNIDVDAANVVTNVRCG